MDTNEYTDFMARGISRCDTIRECEKFAVDRQADAAMLRAQYAAVQDVAFESDMLTVTLLGHIEDLRCNVLQAAEDALNKARDLEDEEADERIHGDYHNQVQSDYRAAVL